MPSIAPLDSDETAFGHIELAAFVGDVPVFASVDGRVHLLGDRHQQVALHSGLLAACLTHARKSLITSGEDGKVCRLAADGSLDVLASHPGWWIDKLACGPGAMIAYGTGKKGIVLFPDDSQKPLTCERSIEGLAFAPRGMRLAIARYNGVDLNWFNTGNPSQFLEWKGAHTGVVFSPDGKYVVSTMQENALHGWRIFDGKHMRMTGYPAKVKSLSFSAKGRWLASSGAPAAIVWPFFGKDGPMGKAPRELGGFGGGLMVSEVSCHPGEEVVAIGYLDGMIMAVRIEDGKEAVLKRAGKGAISSLGWDRAGTRIAYGTEAGEAGVIDLKG